MQKKEYIKNRFTGLRGWGLGSASSLGGSGLLAGLYSSPRRTTNRQGIEADIQRNRIIQGQ